MRNILLIGGSSGVGLEIARELQSDNKIYSFSRKRGDLPQSKNIEWVKFDVMSDTFDPASLPQTLDGMVYCPGSINLKPIRSLKAEDILDDFKLNALGAFSVFQSVVAKLKASGKASAVFFSTVAVGQGMPYHASVSMAKGAVEGMVKSLAAEMAPAIRVNAIAPSLTDTPLASRLLSNKERKEASVLRHPLKRIGKPEDIASMAVFLLSDRSSWVTGQVLAVDGGIGALKVT